MTATSKQKLTRRQVLEILVAAGVLPAVVEAQPRQEISAEVLEIAQKLLDQEFSAETLARITPAVARNLQSFEIVRELEVDDRVEPAPVFRAAGK